MACPAFSRPIIKRLVSFSLQADDVAVYFSLVYLHPSALFSGINSMFGLAEFCFPMSFVIYRFPSPVLVILAFA
jgi:hypothetical protein